MRNTCLPLPLSSFGKSYSVFDRPRFCTGQILEDVVYFLFFLILLNHTFIHGFGAIFKYFQRFFLNLFFFFAIFLCLSIAWVVINEIKDSGSRWQWTMCPPLTLYITLSHLFFHVLGCPSLGTLGLAQRFSEPSYVIAIAASCQSHYL